MEEIWKDISGFNGKYKISNFGRVKSFHNNKELMLKPSVSHYGYPRVTLYYNGISKYYEIHRLVALYFIPNINNLPCVNHKDENKLNNHADNLEWCSILYNVNYGTRNERISVNNKGKPKSEEHRKNMCGKRSDNIKVAWLHKEEIQNSEISEIKLAKMFGVSTTLIRSIKSRI